MRLIDADKINFLWTPIAPVCVSNDVHYEPVAFKWEIDAQPTINALPEVHAHWVPCEEETGEGSNTYKCFACGEIQILIDGTPKENGWNFCPHCGARMDEETDDGRD